MTITRMTELAKRAELDGRWADARDWWTVAKAQAPEKLKKDYHRSIEAMEFILEAIRLGDTLRSQIVWKTRKL